jgi:hypothetical protein
MRRRVCSKVTRTAVLAATLTALAPGGIRHAVAQSDAVTEVARQRYKDGVKAYEAGRFEDARGAFLQAYALKRVPAVLLNLGQSELRTAPPRYEDAGNHLQQFLREHTSATPEERAAAEKGIAEVKRKTGSVFITVDATGAEVAVDGTVVGKSPLLDPVYVKPGKHAVTATLGGKTATENPEAKLGSLVAVNLVLGVSAPPVVAPVPVPTPTPAPVTPPLNPPLQPLAPLPPLAPQSAQPTPDTASSGREPFFDWYKRKPLAWVGTGVAGVGLLGGIIFTAAASAASSKTNKTVEQIDAKLRAQGQQGQQPCASPDGGGVDFPGFASDCNVLRQNVSIYNTDVALAITGWVVFGVGAVGTATYALVDWYPKKKKTGRSLEVVPVVTGQQQGLVLRGDF